MTSRYQILYNGHRYIIQDTQTGMYHCGFVFGVPWPCRYPTSADMYCWLWSAKREVKALEACDRRKAKRAELENPNFMPIQ